jgi:class 3 adenylate cyclase
VARRSPLSLALGVIIAAVDVETRYARRDGAHIAYCAQGDGPGIVLLPGSFIPFDAYDDHPLMARFVARIASLGRVVLTDRRGVGSSDPLGAGPVRAEDWGEDLAAVLDHASLERVAIVAGFDAGHAALALAANHPDRVERMCLVNTFANGPRVVATLGELSRYEAGVSEGFEETGLDLLAAVAPSVSTDVRFRAWFDAAGRRGASPSTALALTTALFNWDITPLLAEVGTPTLVIHRSDNRFINVQEARDIASGLPNGELLEIPGDDHLIWVGDVDPLLDAIESFLTGSTTTAAHRSLATVLFTDLVASTESAARLGDRRWREILDVHDSTARRIVRRHAGEVVKSTGDGLLALFDTPGAAIRAAKDLQADILPLGLAMRAGIHTGEIERRGDDVGGIAVHVAARVQALAGAGEIVVSAVIPALTSGSGFQFDDLGDHQLKGVPGDWRLYRAD